MRSVSRLTRNPHTRRVYEVLKRAGVTATWMLEYERTLDGSLRVDVPDGVRIEPVAPETVAPLGAPVTDVLEDEVVLGAMAGEEPAGYLFCSVDTSHHIDPLETRIAVSGGYIRRVFVSPDHRNSGVATALVARACEWAHDKGAETARALVAKDNTPSRRLFETHGFRETGSRRYVRVGPLRHRSETGEIPDAQ